jgi:hypothetical protein
MKTVIVAANQQNALLNESIMVVKDAANFDLNNFCVSTDQVNAPPSPQPSNSSAAACLSSSLVQCNIAPNVLLKQTLEQKLALNEQEEDAFYIADLGEILRQYRRWMELLPRIEPFYGNLMNLQ